MPEVSAGRRAAVLLLAESGYAPLNPPEWLEKLRPEVALLSVAVGDREGRPSAETLQAVPGYTLLRTDLNGCIELITDGERMWVEVERRQGMSGFGRCIPVTINLIGRPQPDLRTVT